MTATAIPLGRIISPAPVRRAGNRDYPLLSMTMRNGLVAQSSKFKKRVASRDTENYRVVKRGELVVGFPIDEAVLAIQRIVDEGIVSPAYAVWRVDENIADDIYLERFLRSNEAIAYYKAHLRGTTARRRFLPPDKFQNMPIPVPPLSHQRRIIEIIERADSIRDKRMRSLILLDEFLKSIFLEMFGSPISNSKRLPTSPIKGFGRVVTGNTPPRSSPDNYGPGIEWIKSDNVGTPQHFLTPADETLSPQGQQIARIAPAGSTLVTCIAGSPNSIGNAALADRTVAFNQQINAVIPYDEVDPYFLYCQFLVGKSLIQDFSTNSMKGLVSKGRFQEIVFLRPEPGQQAIFGRIFKKCLVATDTIRDGLSADTSLISSITQRAFRGEL